MDKKENIFRKLARWLVRWIFGLKYEEKWFGVKALDKPAEIKFKNGVPDDYRYCLTDEGCHIIYHRFTAEDYFDFYPEDR